MVHHSLVSAGNAGIICAQVVEIIRTDTELGCHIGSQLFGLASLCHFR